MPPKRSSAVRDDRRPAVLRAHVVVHVDGVVAEVGRDLLAEVVEHVAEHDLGALRDEQPDLGLTLTRARHR